MRSLIGSPSRTEEGSDADNLQKEQKQQTLAIIRPTSPMIETMRVLSSRITSPISTIAATIAKSPVFKAAVGGINKVNKFVSKLGNKAYDAVPGTLRPLDDVFFDRLYKDILIKVARQVEDRQRMRNKVSPH